MLKRIFIITSLFYIPLSFGIDRNAIEIMTLLKKQHYTAAVRLMEKEISRQKDKAKKGYYAFLLHQAPNSIRTKAPRHEYAYMAALWAEALPPGKRRLLWIEAGDGFFHKADLEKAESCYKKAVQLIKKAKDKKRLVYVQHKQAWLSLNKKQWKTAFSLIAKNVSSAGFLKKKLLFDAGKIWSESQSFSNNIPLSHLKKILKTSSAKEQLIVTDGLIQGLKRAVNKNIQPAAVSLSSDPGLSQYILSSLITSDRKKYFAPCDLVLWMDTIKNKKDLVSNDSQAILNSCIKHWTKSKTPSKEKTKYLKKTIAVYKDMHNRTGLERWPLALAYDHVNQKKSACQEVILQFTEVLSQKNNLSAKDIQKTASETNRLCQKVRPSSPLAQNLFKKIIAANSLALQYQNDKEIKNALLSLLNKEGFRSVVKAGLLNEWQEDWAKTDLFPELVLLNIKNWKAKEINTFLNRWTTAPLKGSFLNILIAGNKTILTFKELEKWLPLSKVDSYTGLLVWMKHILAGGDKPPLETQDILAKKLIQLFPSDMKKQKTSAGFLALHFLKTQEIPLIFTHWDKVSPAFEDKLLAQEFYEKSFKQNPLKNCRNLPSNKAKESGLLAFIRQSCVLLSTDKTESLYKAKVPSILVNSRLAWDFDILRKTHNKTLKLKTNIRYLETRTSQMIKNLQRAVTYFHRRRWRLDILRDRVQNLLKTQVLLFEKELESLAKSSPHGEKYAQLSRLVAQWR